MKNITLIICAILLVLNLLIGFMFSSYKPFNIGLNSGVIIVNTLLIYSLGVVDVKDGFRISLAFLFLIAAAIEFVMVFFVPDSWQDNITLTLLMLLFAGQVILYVIAYYVSKIS